MNYIKFDLENGYVLKAQGEMLVGGKFVVYKDSMKTWEKPHTQEIVTDEQVNNIIQEVESMTNANTVKIIFE